MSTKYFRYLASVIAHKYRQNARRNMQGCEICGFKFYSVLMLHHIQHLSKGGNNLSENLILLCPNCHALAHLIAKGKHPASFWNIVLQHLEPEQREKLVEVGMRGKEITIRDTSPIILTDLPNDFYDFDDWVPPPDE